MARRESRCRSASAGCSDAAALVSAAVAAGVADGCCCFELGCGELQCKDIEVSLFNIHSTLRRDVFYFIILLNLFIPLKSIV